MQSVYVIAEQAQVSSALVMRPLDSEAGLRAQCDPKKAKTPAAASVSLLVTPAGFEPALPP